MGTTILLEMAGSVALLLFATQMVRRGVERAWGSALEGWLRNALRSGPRAVLVGGMMAVALQSSTAVAVIVSGFAGAGMVPVARALTALLGAFVGSALLTWLFRLDLQLMMPLLLVAGMVLRGRTASRRWQMIGEVVVGTGLVLLSLRLMQTATQPLGQSPFLTLVMGYLAQDWISAFLFAALIAIAFHSSVAAILVVAAIAAHGNVPPLLIVPLVLGINFGAALLPLYLAHRAGHAARLVQLGNVALRGAGAVLALALQHALRLEPLSLGLDPGAATVAFHIGFNLAVAAVGLGLSPWLAHRLARALPAGPDVAAKTQDRGSALNDADLNRPAVALANAAREMFMLCERTETMLARVFDLYRRPDAAALEALKRLDDEVDAITTRIKLYLTRLPQDRLEPDEVKRLNGILIATIKLEQIADIITRNLVTKARKKGERGVDFSAEGWRELTAIHGEVLLDARRAFAVLLSQDLDMAREVVRSKERMRELHADSETRHLARLRAGETTSRQTSALHIDTIHDLKEINSLLVSLTYPVLEGAGMLRNSRLV